MQLFLDPIIHINTEKSNIKTFQQLNTLYVSRHDKTRLIEFYVIMRKTALKRRAFLRRFICFPRVLCLLLLYIYQSSDLKNSIALNIVNAEYVLIICDCKITVYGRFFVNFYEWNYAKYHRRP